MTIEEAARNLRCGKVSSCELTQDSLRTIAREQSRLNAFITITEDLALDQARQADEELARGVDRGPLHGIPYSLKDVFGAEGIRTTYGSRVFSEYIPLQNSAVYNKLRDSGAVLIGKTGLHELAYGVTSNNPHFGTIGNPRDRNCIPGGSSGGSAAAVISDQGYFSIGSDTGGSIRVPASFCGCVGLKPTYGRVSRFGGLPLGASLDHAGPIARAVRDTALVMNAIAGFDRRDDSSARHEVSDYLPSEPVSLLGRRLGLAQNFFCEGLTPEVETAFSLAAKRAEKLGATIVSLKVPDPAELNTLGRLILLVEMSAALEPHLSDRANFGSDVLALFDQGRLICGTDYVNAQRLRRLYRNRWREVWRQIDALMTPTTPFVAPRHGQTTIQGEDIRAATTRFVRPFNVLGLPAVSIPLLTADLPAALQIVGNYFDESGILAVARALECA